ncbi:MAG: ATP-binding cassette domain-containing protein [Cytophagales bacterium]|nr:MAG: ATP-binding cassette domain-containing protein [Cytophagales bacterium]
MTISTQNIGKQFGREWIFRNFTFDFLPNQSYAIIGNNGSGKSTLLKALAGVMPITQGEICYLSDGKKISAENWFKYLAIASPYLELIEEFSLQETIDFYINFKKIYVTRNELIEKLGFQKNKHKAIKFFSSGMKQKLKLGLAMYSEAKILFLDEPTSNLDEKNTAWYLENIKEVIKDKITFICSNQPNEYYFCNEVINLTLFK